MKEDSELHHRGAEGTEVGKDFTKFIPSLCVLCVTVVNTLLRTLGGRLCRSGLFVSSVVRALSH
jgi:hypothetical protein